MKGDAPAASKINGNVAPKDVAPPAEFDGMKIKKRSDDDFIVGMGGGKKRGGGRKKVKQRGSVDKLLGSRNTFDSASKMRMVVSCRHAATGGKQDETWSSETYHGGQAYSCALAL